MHGEQIDLITYGISALDAEMQKLIDRWSHRRDALGLDDEARAEVDKYYAEKVADLDIRLSALHTLVDNYIPDLIGSED